MELALAEAGQHPAGRDRSAAWAGLVDARAGLAADVPEFVATTDAAWAGLAAEAAAG